MVLHRDICTPDLTISSMMLITLVLWPGFGPRGGAMAHARLEAFAPNANQTASAQQCSRLPGFVLVDLPKMKVTFKAGACRQSLQSGLISHPVECFNLT